MLCRGRQGLIDDQFGFFLEKELAVTVVLGPVVDGVDGAGEHQAVLAGEGLGFGERPFRARDELLVEGDVLRWQRDHAGGDRRGR